MNISRNIYGLACLCIALIVACMQPQAAKSVNNAGSRAHHEPAIIKSHRAPAPEITWVNMLSSPPTQPVTIFGRGFSPLPKQNVVTVGGRKANVVSSTCSSITFIIPEMQFPNWHQPIKVITNGVPSRDTAMINVDMRVIPSQAKHNSD